MINLIHQECASMLFIVKDSETVHYEPVRLVLNILDYLLHVGWESTQVLVEDLLGLVNLFATEVDETTSRDRGWSHITEAIRFEKKAHAIR